MKKYKLKNKYKRALKKCSCLLLLLLLIPLYFWMNKNYITNVEYKDGKVIIDLSKDNLKCALVKKNNEEEIQWTKSTNKQCILDYTLGNNEIIIKQNLIKKNYTKEIMHHIETINKDIIYLAINGKKQYITTLLGDSDIINYNIEHNDIINVTEEGLITGLKDGTTKLTISVNDKTYETNIVVTSLITSNILKDDYDFSKPELECEIYSKEDNDLIDEILKDRINDVGYKTRAGAVEAARFLVLEFPYKISYFYENGRQTTNKVDGEGRYYHVGFYLHESRFSSLTGSRTGPKIWGCPLYSQPAYRNIDNGLDCSGYVSWALLNAGFDVKDVGAGFSGPLDLTDYGDVKEITKELINSSKIKVGDLVHSEHSGGHIGMIIGIENDTFYIAQALWNDADHKLTKKDPNVMAVQITKYSFEEINTIFPHVVLMDKYYKEDGNLTNMW